jgi:hypothetical protein
MLTTRTTTSPVDLSRPARGIVALARDLGVEDGAATQELATLAYLAVYAGGYDGTGPLEPFRALASCPRDELFVAHLREAVPDDTVVELTEVDSWVQDGDRALVDVDGVRCYVPVEDLVPDGAADTLRVRTPALRCSVMPGFVVRTGNVPPGDRSRLTRLYLDLAPEGAAWMLGTLARRLDAAGRPFEMKVASNPRAYLRRDAGVLYVPTGTESDALATLEAALAEAPTGVLGAASPALTLPVRPGVGLADDPTDLGGGMSHGQWVSSLLLDALVAARAEGGDPAAVEEHLVRLVVAAGRDLRRPYRRGDGPTRADDQDRTVTAGR